MDSNPFSRFSFVLFLCVFISGQCPVASAAKVELKNGKVYEGEILDQDSTSLIMETNGSVLNIRKDNLKSAPEGISLSQESAPAASLTPPREIPAEADEIDRIHSAQILEQKSAVEKAHNLAATAGKIKTLPHLDWVKGFAIEAAAKNHLRKIAVAVAIYRQESGEWPSGFEALINEKLLEPEFKTGIVGDYQYEIKTTPEYFKIYARPADSTRKLASFLLDSKTGKITASRTAPSALSVS